MRQVFYIEADEEMISVIGRLRKSPASENIIVAPVRSLLLQSIVNLRLLSHDAHKNGKEIIVVTQDEQSRALCEKAGIRTQTFLEEEVLSEPHIPQHSNPVVLSSQAQPFVIPRESLKQNDTMATEVNAKRIQLPFADALGSSDFFGRTDMVSERNAEQHTVALMPKQQPVESLSKALYDNVQQIIVRDKNQKKLTSLNSQRFEEEKRLNQEKSFIPPSLRGTQSSRPIFVPIRTQASPETSSFTPSLRVKQTTQQQPVIQTSNTSGYEKIPLQTSSFTPKRMLEKQTTVSDGGKMRIFFLIFGLISMLSVAGVLSFVFLPKANVHVTLKVLTQKADFEFDGSTATNTPSAESRTIPVKIFEKDQEITHSFDATGKASLSDQKARGSVMVYNEYSVDPQVLVASTRLLSQDGKVFRLLSGVTIPGMTSVADRKIVPGAIEATVVADQSGQDYNIAPTTFTIPGFEGSPKYDKFSAKSKNAMSGGGTSGSDMTSISDQDIADAKKSVESEMKDTAIQMVNQNVSSGEKVLSETIETSIVTSSASPQSGAVTSSFDYRVKFHVRAFVFSEDDMKTMIVDFLAKQDTAKIPSLSPSMIDVQYGEPTVDYKAGTLHINAHAEARSGSDLDQEQLKADLLGQSESDIANLLKKYTQIDSISIELWPEFVSNRIPTRVNRVTIIVDPLNK